MSRLLITTLLLHLFLAPFAYAQKPELVVPVGHTNWVLSVTFSPNGRYALSGSSDKTVKLWDVESGRLMRSFRGHKSGVAAVAFSADGRYVLSGSDKTLCLWDMESGRLLHSFEGVTDYVSSVAFSADGRYVLSGLWDKTAKLWEVNSGRLLRSFEGHTESVSSVAFSADGRYVLSGSYKTLNLWEIASNRLLRSFEGITSYVMSVAFSADGRYALLGSNDNTTKLWEVNSGRLLRSFEGHAEHVESVAFSADGGYVLSGSRDNTLKLWEVSSGRLLRSFEGHTETVFSVAFSADGRYALSGSGDKTLKTVKLWEMNSGRWLRSFRGHTDFVESVAFSVDSRYALSGSWDKTVKLWEMESGRLLRSFEGHNENVNSVAISANGRYILSGSTDKTVKLWEMNSGRLLRSFEGHTDYINSVAFSADGRYALSGSRDKTVKLWEMESGRLLQSFDGHTSWVNSVAFTTDGRYVLSGSSDKTVKLWDVESGRLLRSFRGHTDYINSVAFSTDGRYVLSGSRDNTIKLWDVESSRLLRSFEGHTGYINSVAFTADGRCILSASWDNTTKLWNTATGQEIATRIAIDSTDWVVTTPSGLFDASPGAMKLMYYVVNDSTDHDEPWKVIELDQLKQRYYQPGLLPILMGSRNEPLRQVPAFENVTLPPGIKLSIQSDKLIVQLNNRKGGIGPVSVFINGAEIVEDLRRDPKGDSNQNTLSLELPLASFTNHFYTDAENSIRVVAQNGEGWLRSSPVEISYKPSITARGGVPEKTPSSVDRKTVRFRAVAVGTSNIGLHFAHSDAEQIANGLTLAASELFGPANVTVQLLVTKPGGLAQSTKAAIVKALVEAQQTKAEDVFVLHLSGHAVNYGGQDGDLYFLLAGAKSADVSYLNDPAIRQEYALSSQELIGYLRKIPAKKKVLILDVCSAGKGAEKILAARDVPGSQIRALDRLQERMGLYVLAGSAADAVSYEANLYGQGLVTYALLQGIKGAALRRDGEEFLDVATWFTHVENQVPILAKGVGGIQKPFYGKGSHLGGSVPGQATEGSFDIGKVTESVKAKIHIAEPKPVLLVKNFQEVTEIDDVLDLKSKVESALNDFIATRGSDAPMLTMEAKDYPGAYTLNGLYTLQGEALSVSCKVKKGSVSVGDFVVTGTKSKLTDLVQAVLAKAKEFVKP